MYKIAAIDLDGTMLNKYGAVTDETKSAIKQTIEKGTDVIIASGTNFLFELFAILNSPPANLHFLEKNICFF